ncbi:MAG TPA: hypothetical protein VLT88_02375, partial [Desulfosarcina sp.]|nr:hypothetical protein [Desulfosarcina sp.]
MVDITPLPVRPSHPCPEPFGEPPSHLAQISRLSAHSIPAVAPRPIRLSEAAPAGRRLLDHLRRLSEDGQASLFFLHGDLDPIRLGELLSALGRRASGLRLSMGCTLDDLLPTQIQPGNGGGAVVQIRWRLAGPPPLGLLKAFSRAGVWNHLLLDGVGASADGIRTAALQPDIVHSWTTADGKKPGALPEPVYDQVRPLPGRPLWQVVDDPVARFVLIDRLTKDRMSRLRVAEDSRGLYTVGENLEYHFVPPDRLPDGYLDEICAMVAAGGTVAATYVRSNLERAHLIGYVTERGVIVANSSLKNPRPEYIASVKQRTGLDMTGFVERGYTSVRPEYRGL